MKYFLSLYKQMFRSRFNHQYEKILESVPLSKLEKSIIRKRYINVVIKAESDYRRNCILYIFLTNVITISGVLITGFLSLDKISIINQKTAEAFFWTAWALSIFLTLSNKWLYSFNIHKNYIIGTVVLEKLYSEGWSFVSGIGKYRNCVDYESRFLLFCSRIEKIKMKSIENAPGVDSYDAANDILGTAANLSHHIVNTDHQLDLADNLVSD